MDQPAIDFELTKTTNKTNQVDRSGDIFTLIVFSILLSLGIYALNDQIYNIQLEAGLILLLILTFFIYFCLAEIFIKAGEPGWTAFIPVYGIIILLRIVGKPGWWIFLLLIPVVNTIIYIWVIHLLSLKFGKDTGFTIGMFIIPIIFYPILAFGDSKYINDKNLHGKKKEVDINNMHASVMSCLTVLNWEYGVIMYCNQNGEISTTITPEKKSENPLNNPEVKKLLNELKGYPKEILIDNLPRSRKA